MSETMVLMRNWNGKILSTNDASATVGIAAENPTREGMEATTSPSMETTCERVMLGMTSRTANLSNCKPIRTKSSCGRIS